ncbi:hypothetical protein AgCh_012719 [Apium graveolens]
MSRKPGQSRVSAPSHPGSSEVVVSDPEWPIVISNSPSWENRLDSDDSDSERTLDVIAEKTPMPLPPVPPLAPRGMSGASARSRWVRRLVSTVRDILPGCGPGSSTSRPPVPPSVPSSPSSPIPYHIHRAGIPAPSPDVQERVRSLTQAAVERARTVDHFISFEFRAVQYQDLVNWRMPPKKNIPSNSSSRNFDGGPAMDGLLDFLRQVQVALVIESDQKLASKEKSDKKRKFESGVDKADREDSSQKFPRKFGRNRNKRFRRQGFTQTSSSVTSVTSTPVQSTRIIVECKS